MVKQDRRNSGWPKGAKLSRGCCRDILKEYLTQSCWVRNGFHFPWSQSAYGLWGETEINTFIFFWTLCFLGFFGPVFWPVFNKIKQGKQNLCKGPRMKNKTLTEGLVSGLLTASSFYLWYILLHVFAILWNN